MKIFIHEKHIYDQTFSPVSIERSYDIKQKIFTLNVLHEIM